MKFKVSEIFYSLQGEGLHVGSPSVFARLFGCNLTCSGFGMPKGQVSTERFSFPEVSIKKYSDLPLVSTGCDSYGSWDHRFKHLSATMTAEELATRIVAEFPVDALKSYSCLKKPHVVLTGGEPLLLGWQKIYPELFDQLYSKLRPITRQIPQITFETNGTQILSDGFVQFLNRVDCHLTFSISLKLSCSGEPISKTIDYEALSSIFEYQSYSTNPCNVFFKFVIDNDSSVDEINNVLDMCEGQVKNYVISPVYVMPVGGTESSYYLNNVKVAEIALKNGWNYSPRLQVDLWKNAWGT